MTGSRWGRRLRGLGITLQIESFEARMAAHHAMARRIDAGRPHPQGVRA
jgi:hypothetical protein